MASASHLDFYKKYKISPVRQDISDLGRHFQRREALYRHLGILPAHVTGRRVLEVGPGSGYNSLYTASLVPTYYELVEGNPTGIEHIRALFAGYPEWTAEVAITASRVEEYRSAEPFDFVFCEGLLSGVPNPEEVLSALAAATAPGHGVLVVTCVDHLAHFPETIRRVFADLATDSDDSLDEKVVKILPMLQPHLASLAGMSRRPDDWVVDNLIHPGSIIPLINFPETVAVLASDFQFLASSPHFVQDWRWYKQITGDDHDFNLNAIDQYWHTAHVMMDYRLVAAPRAKEDNIRLYDLCTEARALVERYEASGNRDLLRDFRRLVGVMADDYRTMAPATAAALDEAVQLLDPDDFDPVKVANATDFAPLFGRGTHYISFTRN